MPNPFSLSNQAIVAFVPTCNPEQARTFYRDRLGLRLLSDELPFALVFDANGIMLRVTSVKELTPASHTILGWHVADVESAVRSLREKGVTFEVYSGMSQSDLGI